MVAFTLERDLKERLVDAVGHQGMSGLLRSLAVAWLDGRLSRDGQRIGPPPFTPTRSPVDAALGHIVAIDPKTNTLGLDTGESVEVDNVAGFRLGMPISRGEAR